MFLKRFEVKNFRCIKNASIDFNKGVNILIGENNSGKTAVLDALRVCLSYGKQWRDIWVSVNNFHLDKNNPDADIEDVEFHLFFEIENKVEAGIYNDLHSVGDDGKQELQIHFRYYIDDRSGVKKVRYSVWGGDNEGQSITPDVLDLIYFIHLDALRDAVSHLRPVKGNRLGELYSKIVTDEERQKFLSGKVRNVLDSDTDWNTLIDQGKTKVNEHLKETTITGKEQNVEIDFLPFEFRRIVDNLRIQTPVYSEDVIEDGNGEKQRYFELYQNGLGYNNLIYIATVLGDLKRQKELEKDAYVALLIEEPEAHLYPQLQNIFFNYLNKLNEIGFQIFVSSHSPTITAKAKYLENGQLRVLLAEKTFEVELFKAGNNKDILLEMFGEMHPTAAGRIEEGTSIDDHANSFLGKINSNRAKSELAHCLAIRLESDADLRNEFTVPDYIESAIRWVVKGE